jgi:hypothetical protein
MDELLAQGNPDAKRLMELIGAVEELKAAINEGMELIVHISRKLANDKKPTNNDGKQA